MKRENMFALVRMGTAFLAAVILLAVTGFGFVPMLAGPTEIGDGQELAGAGYVSADLEYVMTLCGEEVRGEKVVAYFAIAPIGNRFVVLRFDAALKGDVEQMAAATEDYLGGESRVMTVHMPVKGMVETAGEEVYDLLRQWFEANKDWMAAAGVVGPEPTEEEYLVQELVKVDTVGSMKAAGTVAWSVLALLLVVYALVELVFLLGGGKKEEKPAPAAKAEKAAEEAKEEAVSEEAAEAAQTPAEEPVSEERGEAGEAPEEIAEETVEEIEEVEESDREEEENA